MIEYRRKLFHNTEWQGLVGFHDDISFTRYEPVSSHFNNYDFRVDGVVFKQWSESFEDALDKEFTWRILTQ